MRAVLQEASREVKAGFRQRVQWDLGHMSSSGPMMECFMVPGLGPDWSIQTFLGGWVEPYLRENGEETRGGEPDLLSQKTYIYLCLCGL